VKPSQIFDKNLFQQMPLI